MKRIIPEKIQFLAATVIKTSILPTQDFLEKRTPPDQISVGFSQSSRFDFEEGLVVIVLDIKLIGKDESEKEIGLEGEYSIEFLFKIDNFDEFIIESKEIIDNKELTTRQVDGVLGGTLMGIAYSTARGIILERTQGTPFQDSGVIIPVINPNDLL
ncbi:MAG: hypothetical protein ACOYXB_03795 [Bacteroidota bacterium]